MFKFFRKQNINEDIIGINMAPMIDIIFQLIIFFMCLMHFKSMEYKLSTYIPKDKEPKVISANQPLQELEVIISLIYNEKSPMTPTIKIGEDIIPNWSELTRKVAFINDFYKNTNTSVIFKVDTQEQIPVQIMIDALNACKQSGIEPQLIRKFQR
ncbi:MAG: biopolymer transporter ExbD [Planctomycetota bacterium]